MSSYLQQLPTEIFELILSFLSAPEYARLQRVSRFFRHSILLESYLRKHMQEMIHTARESKNWSKPSYLLSAVVYGYSNLDFNEVYQILVSGIVLRMDILLGLYKIWHDRFVVSTMSTESMLNMLMNKPTIRAEEYKRYYPILRRMICSNLNWFYFLINDEQAIQYIPREDLEYFLKVYEKIIPADYFEKRYLMDILLSVLNVFHDKDFSKMLQHLKSEKIKYRPFSRAGYFFGRLEVLTRFRKKARTLLGRDLTSEEVLRLEKM